MKHNAMNALVDGFTRKWFVDRAAVMYAVEHGNGGAVPNAAMLKDSIRYAEYKEAAEAPLSKLKARSQMVAELEELIRDEIVPLQMN